MLSHFPSTLWCLPALKYMTTNMYRYSSANTQSDFKVFFIILELGYSQSQIKFFTQGLIPKRSKNWYETKQRAQNRLQSPTCFPYTSTPTSRFPRCWKPSGHCLLPTGQMLGSIAWWPNHTTQGRIWNHTQTYLNFRLNAKSSSYSPLMNLLRRDTECHKVHMGNPLSLLFHDYRH